MIKISSTNRVYEDELFPEFGELPVYEASFGSVSEGYDHSGVVALPDGTYAYVTDCGATTYQALCRVAVQVDYGGNEVSGRRKAPASLAGINRPRLLGPTRVAFHNQVGWLHERRNSRNKGL